MDVIKNNRTKVNIPDPKGMNIRLPNPEGIKIRLPSGNKELMLALIHNKKNKQVNVSIPKKKFNFK